MEIITPFSSRIFKTIFGIIALVLASQIFFYVKDEIEIKEIKAQVNWLEQFYTDNHRYPNESEFYSRFPDKNRVLSYGPNYTAFEHDSETNYNDTQNFALMYTIHNQNKPGAPGKKVNKDMIGIYDFTRVTPCKRWHKLIDSMSIPAAFTVVKSEMGNFNYQLNADFEKGTIALVANNKSKIILNDLKHPRFLHPKKDLGYNENSVLITHDNDVIKYTWSEASGGTLINPEKVADVPTTCPTI